MPAFFRGQILQNRTHEFHEIKLLLFRITIIPKVYINRHEHACRSLFTLLSWGIVRQAIAEAMRQFRHTGVVHLPYRDPCRQNLQSKRNPPLARLENAHFSHRHRNDGYYSHWARVHAHVHALRRFG